MDLHTTLFVTIQVLNPNKVSSTAKLDVTDNIKYPPLLSLRVVDNQDSI